MNLGIEGKIALVTGGARGIGKAIVQALEAEGAMVFFSSRSKPEETLPDADILVNNIGHQMGVTDPHADFEEWMKVFRVNFELAVRTTEAALPHMKKQGWGRVVNIGSLGGHEQQGPVQYCVAKSALSAYTRCMGRTLASEAPGIVMSAVLPGVVVTEDGHWAKIQAEDPERAKRYLKERCPLGRFGTVEEIAPTAVFLCSQQASFAHGAIWTVDGGQSRGFNW